MNTAVLNHALARTRGMANGTKFQVSNFIFTAQRLILGLLVLVSIVAGFVYVGDNIDSFAQALGVLVGPEMFDLSETYRGATLNSGPY